MKKNLRSEYCVLVVNQGLHGCENIKSGENVMENNIKVWGKK